MKCLHYIDNYTEEKHPYNRKRKRCFMVHGPLPYSTFTQLSALAVMLVDLIEYSATNFENRDVLFSKSFVGVSYSDTLPAKTIRQTG